VYVYTDPFLWQRLTPYNVETIVAANLDGLGFDEIILEFPGDGLWRAYWNQVTDAQMFRLHPFPAAHIAAGDVDGNKKADLVIDFGPAYGVWLFRNDTSWSQLHGFSTEGFTLADRDATGKDEVVLDFGPAYGVWQYANDANWSQLHPLSPEAMVRARLR
jgi:hypothetical protein